MLGEGARTASATVSTTEPLPITKGVSRRLLSQRSVIYKCCHFRFVDLCGIWISISRSLQRKHVHQLIVDC
jgi:hypothetical protein